MPSALQRLPSPPPRDTSVSAPTRHVSESQHMVRERRFAPDADLAKIDAEIARTHATGTLLIDYSNGGIGSIRFREEKKF